LDVPTPLSLPTFRPNPPLHLPHTLTLFLFFPLPRVHAVNEVIANRVNQLLNLPLGRWTRVHPNDHVNRAQSSNDTFPTAMHVALCLSLRSLLLPALARLRYVFAVLSERYKDVIKIGTLPHASTHMQTLRHRHTRMRSHNYSLLFLFSFWS
jgi:hypothetical protein